MSQAIRVDEWLAELQAITAPADDGTFKTVEEWSRECGISNQRLRKLLKRGKESGSVVCGLVRREQLNGVLRDVPAYRIVGKPAKKGGKR